VSWAWKEIANSRACDQKSVRGLGRSLEVSVT